MHPSLLSWRCARRAFPACGGYGAWRGRGGPPWGVPGEGAPDEGAGGGFGVRRPLRFLAQQLDLDDRQVAELAVVLDELKTERAQAEVDRRRTLAAFADALGGDAFDAPKAAEAGALRIRSAERLRDAVLKALQRLHALLKPEQRDRLAYLLRTGALSI